MWNETDDSGDNKEANDDGRRDKEHLLASWPRKMSSMMICTSLAVARETPLKQRPKNQGQSDRPSIGLEVWQKSFYDLHKINRTLMFKFRENQ
jgi:hypothetical protein